MHYRYVTVTEMAEAFADFHVGAAAAEAMQEPPQQKPEGLFVT